MASPPLIFWLKIIKDSSTINLDSVRIAKLIFKFQSTVQVLFNWESKVKSGTFIPANPGFMKEINLNDPEVEISKIPFWMIQILTISSNPKQPVTSTGPQLTDQKNHP